MPITRHGRIRLVGVTLGLSAAGIVFGGIAGVATLALIEVLSVGSAGHWDPSLLLSVGLVGAMVGAICAPLAGWLFLRQVPLGRAFAGLTLGTIIGGVVGAFGPDFVSPYYQPLALAAVGFLVAAGFLRFTSARSMDRAA